MNEIYGGGGKMIGEQCIPRVNSDVLIVDDNAANLTILSDILIANGYSVITCTSGEQALLNLKEKLPSIILLDVMMPGINCFEVCRRLKSDPITHDIPIIFICALEDEESRVTGFKVGGADYISKPFRKHEILARVKSHVQLYNLLREREIHAQTLIKEIESRKLTEDKLFKSEEQYRTTLYGIGDGVITTDNQGRIKLMNAVAENLTGWSQAEAVGKALEDVFRIINEETRDKDDIPFRKVLRDGIMVGLGKHSLLISKDGNEIPIADNVAPILNSEGEIVGVVLVFRDQIKERQAEFELRTSEERFRNLFENSSTGISIANIDGSIRINEAFCEMLGYQTDELINKKWKEITHPDDIEKSIEAADSLLQGKTKSIRFEKRYLHKNGNIIWTDVSTTLQRDQDSNPIYFITSIYDITKRKKAEESLHKFKLGIENSTDAIFITNTNGTIESINTAFEKIYGFTASEAIGQTPRIIKSGLLSQSDYQHFWNTLQTKKPVAGEIPNKAKDGRIVIVDTANNPILDDNGEIIGFISINRDITERKKTENKLKESEERFRNLADSSPLAICIYQDEFWVYTNRAGEKMSGYSAQELYQKKYWEFVAPEYQELVRNNGIKRLDGKGEESPYEFRIITKEGESRWVILTGSSINYNERPAGIITVVDITEWKKAKVELLDASNKMQAFFEQSLDGFFFMTMDVPIEWNDKADKELLLEFIFSHLKITKVNDAMLSQYGADRQHFLGITPNDFFIHDIEQGKSVFRKILEAGKLHTVTDERKLNGESMFIEGDYTCLFDSEGRMTGLFGIQRDITASMEMTEILKESERKYKYLFENNPAPMWIYDLETLRFLEVNNTAIIQYGYSREEFLSMTIKNIRPEDDIDSLLKDVEQTVTPFTNAGIWRHVKKNGDIIFVEITSHEIEFDERSARMVIINDISERKTIEESLVGSENSLKEAQLIANMGDWEFDLIKNKSKWSENCYRLYDLEPFEIIPTFDYFRSRIHPDDLHIIDEGYTTILHSKSPIELELRITFPDNRVKWILNKIIPTFNDNELVFLKGVNIDITERKKAEDQLRLLSKSIEQSPVSVVITNKKGIIEYVNPSFTKRTGYTEEEALGKNPRVLKSGMHDALFYEKMWKTLLSGQPWIGEILNMKKNGDLYWENAIISPIFNYNGAITHFLAAKEDITEKKKLFSDLIREKERAEESDRLKSAFLANMSHEVRTPLNSIIGFSELLVDPDFEEEQKNEFIQLIITNGNSLLTIISDIMDISKLESSELKIYKKHIKVKTFLSSLVEQYSFQIKAKDLEFNLTFTENCDTVTLFTDEDRLRQIFINLIGNALKFTSNGNIEIGCTKKNNSIEFYVKDSGIGIPAEYHDKIFDRFRQVEDANTRKYGGNGLGLAITKSLIELMDGKIWVESEFGKGSTFYFSLPLTL
ncbi:MAG: hypothetical protein A2066_00910 [Bacteroidetes bacterium GWB2_41_8]|nr:MAG: hypothetical protein A2066_00910 [Bacteroidetes bacterium GWB2_41_8]